jgi:putative hydrolase of the HAD superfamily
MPGALPIDFDGVLRIWDAGRVERIEEQAGLPVGAIQRVAFAPGLLRQALVGNISDEAWRAQVAVRLRADFPQAQADRAVSLWSESPGEVDAGVLTLVQPCRARAKVVLITNATTRPGTDLARLRLTDAFDHIINSSEIGYAKPEPEVFKKALAAAGVPSHDALFVDDD